MKYYLFSYGSRPSIEITQEEYEDIRNAKSYLSDIIRIEENFDAVMEDYVELEETLLRFGIRHLAFMSGTEDHFHMMRGVINRRVLHLLSTARLYRDGLQKRAKARLSREDFYQLKAQLIDSPSQPMSFRIVEALRNYTQHDDFPISGMTTQMKWEEGAERIKDRAAFSVTPKFDALEVSKARKLAADVRKALSELGSDAQMISHIREYVEHLGAIHSQVRKLVEQSEKNYVSTLRSAMARYQAGLPENTNKPIVVIAVKWNEKTRSDEVQMFDEFFDYRTRLKSKNNTQENLSRRYVKWHGLEESEEKKKKSK